MDNDHSHDVLPLPAELPASQQGTSEASTKNYTARVSNAAGYLCHIAVECSWDVPPSVLFQVFTHADNAGCFRDIKAIGFRKVLSCEPGLKRVQVEQCGELRVMWLTRVFRTLLDVTEDARDPECLRTEFALNQSDVLARFHGAWELRPRREEGSGRVVGCHATLTQDVLPRGVPTFFARLPVLGGLLRQVSLGTIKRLMEDITHIVNKYKAAGGKLTVGEVLVAVAAERGHKTDTAEERPRQLVANANSAKAAAVASFAVDDVSSECLSEEASDEQLARGHSQQQQQQAHGSGGGSAARSSDTNAGEPGQAAAAAAGEPGQAAAGAATHSKEQAAPAAVGVALAAQNGAS